VPAQSSRSIGFLMLVGSSLTLCGLICNNNAMLSPSLLRYYPSKLWGEVGAPGGTVRRAAVRKRGSGSTSLY